MHCHHGIRGWQVVLQLEHINLLEVVIHPTACLLVCLRFIMLALLWKEKLLLSMFLNHISTRDLDVLCSSKHCSFVHVYFHGHH
jgi:hypothetical protein